MPGKRQEVRMTTHLRWTNTEMVSVTVSKKTFFPRDIGTRM